MGIPDHYLMRLPMKNLLAGSSPFPGTGAWLPPNGSMPASAGHTLHQGYKNHYPFAARV